MDEEVENIKNPDTFDPSVQLRGKSPNAASQPSPSRLLRLAPFSCGLDYSVIHLPTFTVSAREFTLLSHVDRDGRATCFSDPADTGIPALQSWYHQLTLPFREEQARLLWQQLREFLLGARSYLSATDV